MYVSTVLKGTHFIFIVVVAAAGVVSFGGAKMSSSIVQLILYFWPFAISKIFREIRKYNRL